MRWRVAWAIFRKEILETVRDRRTLVVMLVLPIALYPILLVGFGQVVTHQVSKLEAMDGRIAVLGELPAPLGEAITADESLTVVASPIPPPPAPHTLAPPPERDPASKRSSEPVEEPIPEGPHVEWARQALADGWADVVLVVPEDAAMRLAAGESGVVMVLYDGTDDAGRFIENRVMDLLYSVRRKLLEQRLSVRPELPEGFDRPLVIDSHNLAPASKKGGYLAGRIIPTLLLIMVLLGAFYPAIDLTAGEKERGTMQTLLTAPAHAMEIIVGKFLTVFVVSMVSAVANLLSMALAIAWMLQNSQLSRGGGGVFSVDAVTVLIILVQLVPIALFFSAIMMAVAIFAQSFKEAQNYLTPLYMIIILPALISGLPGIGLDPMTAWVPGLNITLLMKDLLVEPLAADLIVMVLIANSTYGLLALVVAARIFQSEEVLLGGEGALVDAFRLGRSGTGRATATLSVVVFCLGLVVCVYLGSWLQGGSMVWGMIATQLLLMGLPALLVVRGLGLPLTDTLLLRRPRLLHMAAALLLGSSSWIVVGRASLWVQSHWLELPPSFIEQMNRALGLQGALPDWQILLAFAVAPGLCEELFFRGLILSGLRNSIGRWPAILIAALMFGIFHISIYRIFPTACMGVLIAYVAMSTGSIWPGVLLHMLNNGVALMASQHGWLPGALAEQADPATLAVASLLFAAGLLCVRSSNTVSPNPAPPTHDAPPVA